MSAFDDFLGGSTDSLPGSSPAPSDKPGTEINQFLKDAPPKARGLKGWTQDVVATGVKGAIGVPELAVGLADIATGGEAGKLLENKDGAVGFRPKQAREMVNEWHSEATLDAQRKFQEADGIVDKAVTAVQNPSLVATAVGESLPTMGAGGVAARGLMTATKLGQMGAKGAAVAGAIGEGVAMAGSAAEQIRQESEDGLLTPGQTAAAVGTGAAGTLIGVGGARLAQRLGIGDVDTMLAQGQKGLTKELQELGMQQRAAKSIPRQVIEGAIAEGLLEELPQSVAEQVFQNIALGKPWYEDVDSAVVLGTLSGGAMGAGAAGYRAVAARGFQPKAADPAAGADGTGQTPQDTATPPANPGLERVRQAYAAQLQALQQQEQGETLPAQTTPPDGAAVLAHQRRLAEQYRQSQLAASRAVTGPDDEILESTGATTRVPPSVAAGLNPAAQGLEGAAALAVDTGAARTVQAQTRAQSLREAIDPETGEVKGQFDMAGWSDQQLSDVFKNAQSKEVRRQLAMELSRRRTQRTQAELQQELQAELTAPEFPANADSAFAQVREDAGPVPDDIQIQGAAPRRAATPQKGQSNAPQADQAQQAETQPAQAGGAPDGVAGRAAAAGRAQGAAAVERGAAAAQVNNAGARIGSAGAAWTRMPAAERQAVAARLPGVKPIVRSNLAGAKWENLNSDLQAKIADAIAPAAATAMPPLMKGTETAGTPAADARWRTTYEYGSKQGRVLGYVRSEEGDRVRFMADDGETVDLPPVALMPVQRADSAEAVADAAHEAATSPLNDLPQPTEAQKEAGNYKKGHVIINGLDISIENAAGTRRRPEWPPLAHHYGYFKGSVGADKDHVDVFLTDRAGDASLPVFVVDQVNKDGSFDEHKAVMGTATEEEARAAYLDNYERGWTGLGAIKQMTLDEFKAWVMDPAKTRKPVALPRGVLAKMAQARQAQAVPPPSTAMSEEEFAANLDAYVVQYRELAARREGNPDYYGTDLAKELFPEYGTSIESRRDTNDAVQPRASIIAFEAFKARLAEPKTQEQATAFLMAGGPGSGKTTLRPDHGIVYDSTSSSLVAARRNVKLILDSGRDVEYRYVFTEPESALRAAIKRGQTQAGRQVSLNPMVSTHTGAYEVVQTLMRDYAGNERVSFFLFNNTGFARQQIDSLPPYDYNGLRERLTNILDQEHADGRVSAAEYRAITGNAPAARSDQADSRSGSQTTQDRGPEQSQGLVAPSGPRQLSTTEQGTTPVTTGRSTAGALNLRDKTVKDMTDEELQRALAQATGEMAKREPKIRKEMKQRGITPDAVTEAMLGAGLELDDGVTPGKWIKKVSGLNDVMVDITSGPGEPVRARVRAMRMGGDVFQNEAEGLPAILENIEKMSAGLEEYRRREAAKTLLQGKKLEQTAASTSTAPEHQAVGVDDRELGQIVREFNAAQQRMVEDDEKVTHVFDPPAKSEIVRLADKAKVYHKDHGWMTPAEAKAKIAEWKQHAAAQFENDDVRRANSQKIVLSLFDLTGSWSAPWEEAGYQVFRFDIQDDSTYTDPETGEEKKVGDVNNMSVEFFNDLFGSFDGNDVHAVLAACPCTDFAVSGARHFAAKDADGRTVASVKLVHQTLNVIEYFKPAVWAIENPVGRIEDLGGLPPWRLSFDPNHLGDPYTKKTLIWGRFNADLPVAPVEPTEGSKMHRLYGGKSLATKNARSATPEGFSYGFFMANNAADHPAMAISNKYDRLDRALIEKAVKAGVTEQQINAAVEDLYYQSLDDAGANAAIQELIDEATPPAGRENKATKSDQPFTHAGLKVYPTRVREQGGAVKQRWAIQTPDNAAREQRGERQIGGDELVDTREQAMQRAEDMAARAEREAQDKAELEQKERNQAEQEAAQKAEAENIDGFMPNAVKVVRARVIKTLNTQITQGGRPITRKALVRERVAAGAKVEQAKEGRRLVMPSGAYLGEDQISKTAMDYAEHLIAQRGAAPAEAAEPRQQALDYIKWWRSNNPGKGPDDLMAGIYQGASFQVGESGAPFTKAGQIMVDGVGASDRAARTFKVKDLWGETDPAGPGGAQPAQATHQDPGEKPEAATKAVVADSLQKAAKNEGMKPSEMKKWLLKEIDQALADIPGYGDFLAAAKSMGDKPSKAADRIGNQYAQDGHVTFNVPGDGRFKVAKSVRNLFRFRDSVEKSPAFRDFARQAPASAQDSVRNGSRSKEDAVIGMIEEGDFEAAKEYAEAVDIDISKVKVPKGDFKPDWDEFLKTGKLPEAKAIERFTFPVRLDVDTLLRAFPSYRSYGIKEATLEQDGQVKIKSTSGMEVLSAQQSSAGNDTFMAAFLRGELRKTDKPAEEEKPKASKPKDTGWNMAGTGYAGKRYRGRNITLDDGREVVARIYENAGAYEDIEIKIDGVSKFRGTDRYKAEEKADAMIAALTTKDPELDLMGFTRTPMGNGIFQLRDGDLLVEVQPTLKGLQAVHRSAKSSPSLTEQQAIEWAANLREDMKREKGAEKTKPAAKAAKGDDALRQQLEDHFAPGNVILSDYWKKHDRVVSFDWNGGNWSVKVQGVEKKDGQWEPAGEIRTHSTRPDKGDKVVERGEDAPAQAGYSLPKGRVGDDWRGSEAPGFKPTARQQTIMDAVRKALDDGKFYNDAVQARAAEILGVSSEVLARNESGVNGGDFRYDAYFARKAVEAMRLNAAMVEAAQALNLKVGDKIGAIVHQDGKMTNAVTVTQVGENGYGIELQGRRGVAMAKVKNMTSLGLKEVINRAKEKGRRKDGFDEFVQARQGAAVPPAEATDDRDTFTLERLNHDTNQMEPVTFERGEYVRLATTVAGKDGFGEIDGISQARREFKVGGVWYPMGAAYKTERPAQPAADTVPLSSVIDKVNAKNGEGLTEADRVPGTADIGWDAMSAEQRTQILTAPGGWATKKGALNVMGKNLVQRAWADIVPATRATIEGLARKSTEAGPQPASKTPTVDEHAKVMAAVHDGSATPEQFQASFEAVVAGKDAIKAELSTKTKDELLREGGAWMQMRYRNEKKDDVVDAFYRDMVGEYALGQSVSYGMGKGAYETAIRKLVVATDADKLAQYVKDRQAATAEAVAQREARAAALEDPKTLDDYRNLLNMHIRTGKTRKEAFLMLTPEQRTTYDTLEAEATREAREARKRALKTDVRAAGQSTSGQIIETKHTRDGYDLFVVQLSDRVSKEDYQTLLSGAKRMGGWYSSFRGNGAIPGFQFKERASAEAFNKLAGGDTAAAQAQADTRRDAFEDDRSQTAVERLTTMADKLTEQAEESLALERKANTARRARFAASAEAAARMQQALAKTMRNIAQSIEAGKAKFLDSVRTKTQVELLASAVHTAKDNELRAKYDSYAEQQKRKGQPPTAETADYAEFPSFTAFRSDLAVLARQMLEVEGTKKLGTQLMKVADDVTDAYLEFAKANLYKVSQFGTKGGSMADFANRETAERAIKRSGLVGKAIVLAVKRGENRVILSPSEAISRGIWTGDGDKRITLTRDFGHELVQAIGRRGNKSNGLSVPWQFENAATRLKAWARLGIETPSEFRSALREFIALREEAQEADRVKMLERAMVGRKNDGLDFFPTPQTVADQMVEAADIEPDMAVLEPSAGMGHIADRIREAGAEPDVIELASDRRELLEAKGYHVMSLYNDFMDMKPREFYTYGDVFRAPDGTEGVMHGGRGWSGRASLHVLNDDGTEGAMLGWYDRDELTGIRHRGSDSGYDRIVMNPPFSDRRDAQHVQHAYTLLKPGGRIVAIMGEGVFHGQDKKAQAFRDWLEEVGGTDEKLPDGSFMDPSLPVNTGVSARMVVIDKPVGRSSRTTPPAEAREDEAAFRGQVRAEGSPTDRAVMDMVREGRGAQDILQLVAGTSKSRFNRQVARLLLKTGVNPAVKHETGDLGSGGGFKFLAKYSRKNDAVSLTDGAQAQAEHIFMHETIHAATLRALDRKGVASVQMRKLYEHVKKQGGAAGQYGMKNVGEFVAEVFTNHEFQRAIKDMSAPAGNSLKTAWDAFVRILRAILGLPQDSTNALSRALELGVAVMREDMALRQRGAAKRSTYDAHAGVYDNLSDADRRLAALFGGELERPGARKRRPTDELTAADLVPSTGVDTASLPEDMQDLLISLFGMYQMDVPERLPTRRIPVSEFPTAELADGVRDRRGKPYARKMMGADTPPIIVNGNAWLDGRHRVWAAKQVGNETILAIDLAGILPVDLRSAIGTIADPAVSNTNSEAFRKWFGDSKVVDAQGKPLVVYHGTAADIRVFDSAASGRNYPSTGGDRGFFFTSSAATASVYAEKPALAYLDPADADNADFGDGTANIMPVYLSLQSPIIVQTQQRADKHFDYNRSRLYARAESAGADGIIVKGSDRDLYVAFRSEQIKSAIGNRGAFDPEDPDISYFGTADLAGLKSSALDQIQQVMSHPGKVSLWDKTVGTMRNLAERAPAFKPVFDSAQRYLDDVSMLGNDTADHAPRLLPRVESWRDLTKKPITPEENKAIARPLFEGTLMWGRDFDGQAVLVSDLEGKYRQLPAMEKVQILLRYRRIDERVAKMWQGLPLELYEKTVNTAFENRALKAGVVWTDDELKSIFKLDANQIGLYREARAAIDRSIDMTTRADMMRALGDEYAAMRDAVLDQPTLDDARALLVQTLKDDAQQQPDNADRITDLIQAVELRYEKATELRAQGYAPLSRFGRYTVDVVDAAGERQYFGMFETMREANQMALRMKAEFGARAVTQGTMSAESYKLFAGITPESLEMFGDMLGLDSKGDEAKDRAFQAYLQLAKNNHSALKRLIHRKGIAGFSEDVGRVLASFAYSNARLGAGALNAGTIENAINAIPKEQGELKDLAVGLRDYIHDPQEEGQAVRGMLFAQYLGGSLASAFVNTTQPFSVTIPWLSQYGGIRKAAAQMARALNDMRRSMTDKDFKYEKALADALHHAEADGVVSPQEIHQLMAQARGTGALRTGDGTRAGDLRAAAGNKWEKLKVLWGQPFALAEQFNRRSTFIAAFRLAQERGITTPAEFARRAVLETQFLYSKANKMRFARGAIGGTLMTFKTYSVSYLELMHRMWTQGGPEGKRAVGWAVVMLLLMGGAGGLPFMEDAEDLIDGAGQLMGYNLSTKQWRKELLGEVVGKEFADFMENGVSGLPGAPIDVSGRLGMGNLIPGTGLLLSKQNRERDLLEVAGPAGDLVARGFTGGRKVLTGDVVGAALEVSPTAVRNAAQGIDMAVSGIYKDRKGYKVIDTTLDEAASKFLGFQPKSVAQTQETAAFMQRSKSFYIQTSAEIKAQWADALFRKDEAALQRVRQRLADWNEKNPEQRIVVRMPDVWKRVREMGKDREERIAATAPKALRQQMREITSAAN